MSRIIIGEKSCQQKIIFKPPLAQKNRPLSTRNPESAPRYTEPVPSDFSRRENCIATRLRVSVSAGHARHSGQAPLEL